MVIIDLMDLRGAEVAKAGSGRHAAEALGGGRGRGKSKGTFWEPFWGHEDANRQLLEVSSGLGEAFSGHTEDRGDTNAFDSSTLLFLQDHPSKGHARSQERTLHSYAG